MLTSLFSMELGLAKIYKQKNGEQVKMLFFMKAVK